MRVRCRPLEPTGNAVRARTEAGAEFSLTCEVLAWTCRERRLLLQVISGEPVALPASEPSEPVVSAIARVARAIHGSGAVLVLCNPAEAIGRERIADVEGVRCFAIANPADESCWDAALSLGIPIYGVRDTIVCEVRSANARGVLSALSYGLFTANDGEIDVRLDEHRRGVRFETNDASTETTVIVRGGFEAAKIAGASGEWQDRGNETYVRLMIRSARGRCWTQPRFIAPSVAHV